MTRLPTSGYDPNRMDYKLLINPLFPTTIYGDDKDIHAVAMDESFQAIAEYTRGIPKIIQSRWGTLASYLFPFEIRLRESTSGYLDIRFLWHGWHGFTGTIICLIIYLGLVVYQTHAQRNLRSDAGYSKTRAFSQAIRTFPHRYGNLIGDVVLIIFAGIYGLLATIIISPVGSLSPVQKENQTGS